MHIEILAYHPNAKNRINDMRKIFFESASTQSFESEDAKEKFFQRWAGIYLSNWPELVYFCCGSKTGQTLGYLLGCPDTAKAHARLGSGVSHYPVFEKYHKKFPAHLHINMDVNLRSRGAGSYVLQEYIIDLKKMGIQGVHAVTAHGNKNNSFYLKNNFNIINTQDVGDKKLAFFGLSLGRFSIF